MPIYAYRCEACGHQKDVLQKISDNPLTVCPACNKESFKKQLTAPGFQLKGSGWYATDFKQSGTSSAPAAAATAAGDTSASSTASAASSGSSDSGGCGPSGCPACA